MSTTTTVDVVHDIIAALEMYTGLMGSETTTLDDIGTTAPPRHDRFTITLSDGSRYRVQVREETT